MTNTTAVLDRPAKTVAKSPNPATIRTAVAASLRAHGQHTWHEGWMGIEEMAPDKVASLNVMKSRKDGPPVPTIFAVIGDMMQTAGHTADVTTVGGVTEGLLGRHDPKAAKDLAHKIGCHCHQVDAETAARAVEALS